MKFLGLGAAVACLIAGPALAQQLAPSPTLDAVQKRGHIECGVHLGLPGFSFANDKGEWTGLDVDYCKSLAAAVLGDATKVKFTPTSVQQRWPVLQSGQVDLLKREPDGDLHLAVLGPGEFFGEMDLLDESVRSLTVVALKETVLEVFDRERDEHAELGPAFMLLQPCLRLRHDVLHRLDAVWNAKPKFLHDVGHHDSAP